MHICFLTDEYPPGAHGGIGSFTQTLCQGLSERGNRVTVLGNYPIPKTSDSRDEGVRVIRIPKSRIPKTGFAVNTIKLNGMLWRIHKKHKIDIIEGPNLSLGGLFHNPPVTKILRIHSTISTEKKPKFFRTWLIKRSFKIADHVCAVSRFSAESNRNRLNLGDRPMEIIPNPVDTSLFFPKSKAAEDEGLILFIGTVCENKGIRQLIQAMPRIVDAVPACRLWVVGRDWPDPETGGSFTALLKKLIPSGLDKHIIFKGPVEHTQIPDIISRAQVCVYPSHLENMPVAWLEGMAMGKAVVASMTGPGPEVLEDRVSGLLCDPKDPASIAEKVIKSLQDAALRKQLAAQARLRVVEKFSLDMLVKHNEEYYRQCIQKQRAT